ncbi:acetate--CoA ligase family protein [Solibacillus isronensis]|uniref:acetate--CoA ligase family protein n=1 Tax=Solibacillus isronensis TaxID=412383 RepID=UPI00138ACBD1|nr:acetate--CoA ligase family protein [Solibacillus isronensis]
MTNEVLTLNNLDALFNPKSIAIIGASPDSKKIGGRPLSYLQNYGYKGDVYPINPKYDEINGLTCFHDILSVENSVDVAIIALPSSAVIENLEKCAKQGVKSVVIFSAGFGEIGQEGELEQQKIVQIAKQYGIRVLGPNCLGLFNVQLGFYGTFSTIIEDEKPLDSKIGFVSQSGAFGSHVFTLARQQNIGFSYFIATGNEADVDVADCIEYLATDPNTDVIACYIEGVKDGNKLINAFKLAKENNKPVIALKVGTTEVGMKAAMSHTGSIVGSDAVFDTVFSQSGVYRATTIDEFLDVTYVASQLPSPKGNRAAVFTISGGVGIMLADQLAERGFTLPETPDDVKEKLKAILPIAGTQNPIDTTAQISYIPTLLEDFIDAVLSSGSYDTAIVFLGFAGLKHDSIKERIETLRRMKDKFPHIPQITVTINSPQSSLAFREAGVPVIQDPTRAVIALRAMKDFGEFNSRNFEQVIPNFNADLTGLNGDLTEYTSKKFLQQFDLPITNEQLVTTEQEAIEVIKDFQYPLVLKGMSPQILHKTDKGLVSLNITSEEQAIEEFNKLKAIIEATPNATFEGILIQEMIKGDFTEMFVGSKRDPIFGQMVIVGLGGIYIEVLKDISMRKAPVSREQAKEMIEELSASQVLQAYRGKKARDIDALSKLISDFSKVIATVEEDILEADLNPVMVFDEGHGVKIADGLITLKN